MQTVLVDPEGRELATDIGMGMAEAVILLSSLQVDQLGSYRCRTSVFSNELNTPVTAEQTFSIDSE